MPPPNSDEGYNSDQSKIIVNLYGVGYCGDGWL